MSLLQVNDLRVTYGAIPAIKGISFQVAQGEMLGIVGRNGAGKSTIMRAICGLTPASGGSVVLDGTRIDRLPAHEVVKRGVVYVPEGRRVFADMSVADNLRAGGFTVKSTKAAAENLERVYGMFPLLRERAQQLAGTLSGGQQQMLAIGRALMCNPRLIMLDEPSMGLAPIVVDDLFASIRKLHQDGLTVIVVEQKAMMTLKFVDRAIVVSQGVVTVAGTGAELLANPEVQAAYLGQGRQAPANDRAARPSPVTRNAQPRQTPSLGKDAEMPPTRSELHDSTAESHPTEFPVADDRPVGRPMPVPNGASARHAAEPAVVVSGEPSTCDERPIGQPTPVTDARPHGPIMSGQLPPNTLTPRRAFTNREAQWRGQRS